MTSPSYSVSRARREDIPGILALQEANLPENGGQLSVRLTGDWFTDTLDDGSLIVARDREGIAGYVAGTPLARQIHIPIVQALLKAFSLPPQCYFYGPVCVCAAHRGRGLAQEMFKLLHADMGGRSAALFIRDDNTASLRAHLKMGMTKMGEFMSGDTRYAALSFAPESIPGNHPSHTPIMR